MAQTQFIAPVESAQGKIFGKDSKFVTRTTFGKVHSYTYNNPPKFWSKAQVAYRQRFAIQNHFAHLLRRDPELEAAFHQSFTRQLCLKKHYNRLDNYVSSVVRQAFLDHPELLTLAEQIYSAPDPTLELQAVTTFRSDFLD